VAHLRAVPDPEPEDDGPVDPAAAVAPEPPEQSDEEPRRYPSTIGGAFYLSILAAAGTALVIAARSNWRLGVQMLGGAMVVAALLRLVLAKRDAGMLAVRNRFLDVALLLAAGIALIVLATSIPDMPAA
jgi:hypothetical protein